MRIRKPTMKSYNLVNNNPSRHGRCPLSLKATDYVHSVLAGGR